MQAERHGSRFLPAISTGLLWPLFFSLAVLMASNCHAAFPEAWKNVQPVQIDRAGLVKFSVPIESIDAARPNFEDLRLYDASGREIPYFLERPIQRSKAAQPTREFKTVIAEQASTFEFPADLGGQSLAGLTLETPAPDFIKRVQVEGSRDRENWEVLVQGAQVFRLPKGASKTYVEVPPGSWPYIRVSLDDSRSSPIPVTSVLLHPADIDPGPSEDLSVTITEINHDSKDTRLSLRTAAAHVTLAGLAIETSDALFTRQVTLSCREYLENTVREQPLARDTLFRVALEGQDAFSKLDFAMDVTIPSREVLLTIHNADSPPLHITGIKALRRPVYLTFLAPRPGEYYCLSGNPRAAVPRYDLDAQRGHLGNAGILATRAGILSPNPDYRPAALVPDVPAGSTLDPAKWKYRKGLEISGKGVQQLDLDLEVLSRSGHALSDLRLICNEKQLPYLVERTAINRPIALAATGADDPKRPGVSRWTMELPLPSLPLSSLSFTTNASYFKRGVRLYDEGTNERGATYQRLLAQALWTHTPEMKEGKLSLALNQRLAGNRLVLEIDNGDNQPLRIENFQAWYTLDRIFFKVPDENGQIFLYYGNDKAAPPRYELDLIASQLMAAEKGKAAAGPEQALRGPSWSGSGMLAGNAGVVFWVALAVVVAALLFIIARLLPPQKPEE